MVSINVKSDVRSIIDFLNGSESDYCIMDSAKELDFAYESDLDLYVNKKDIGNLIIYLEDNKWKKVVSAQFKGVRFFYYKIVDGFKVKLDISTGYNFYYNHYYFVYNGGVTKRKFDGCSFLSNKDYFFFVIFKDLKYGISNKRMCLLSNLAKGDNELLSLIKSYKVGDDKVNEVVQERFSKPVHGHYNYFNLIKLYSRRLCLTPSKPNITFVGLDGSGKGTYINLLSERLKANNFTVKNIYLGYSQYNIGLINYLVEKELTSKNKIAINIFRIIYLLLLPIEFTLKRGRGSYDIVIIDRHPNVEKIFNESSCLSFYDKMISTISPKIDCLIHLDGDKKVLWERKKEMPYSEYLTKSDKLTRCINNIKCNSKITVDTCLGVDSSFEKIWSFFKNESI